MNLVLNSDIYFCSTPILFCSLSFFLSFTLSLSASCVRLRSLKATVLICPALNCRQPKQCNKQHCGSDHIWHRHGGREEEEHKEGEKRNTTAGDQWTGRKLGIFQQKRMQSVDLAGFVLADARKSCSKERVTNSSLMVTLPHS